jgi:hypothetical protein
VDYRLSCILSFKIRIGYDLKDYDKGLFVNSLKMLFDMKASNLGLFFVFYLVV